MTFAAWMKSVRKYLLPRLEMRPEDRLATGAVLPGYETQPRAKVTAAFEGLAVPIAATMAVEMIGPI